jgi:Ni/Co efflux regulator RcnB
MRIYSILSTAVCLVLLAAASSAAAPSAEAADAPAAVSKASTTTPAATAVSDAAAKKHAKRTACLKDAKSKKLVGADKTSYLRGCIAAP